MQIILELINFCNCRIPILKLATLSLQYLIFAKTNWTFLCSLFKGLCSFYFPVYLARFSNCMQKFQQEKKLCINHWNLINEQQPIRKCSAKIDILQNNCLTEYQTSCVIKTFEKYQWRSSILVKLKAYSLQPQ